MHISPRRPFIIPGILGNRVLLPSEGKFSLRACVFTSFSVSALSLCAEEVHPNDIHGASLEWCVMVPVLLPVSFVSFDLPWTHGYGVFYFVAVL